MPDCKLYINGEWKNTVSGKITENINPATGKPMGMVQQAGPIEVGDAIKAAHLAFPAWSATLPAQREEILLKAAEYMAQNKDRFTDWLIDESGSTFTKASDEISQTIAILRDAAGECRRLEGKVFVPEVPGQLSTCVRVPLGVVAGIAPFNYPVVQAACKSAYAIAAGNTFVLKPASDTPLSGNIMAECYEAAGLPAGVFNAVAGSGSVVGNALVESPLVRYITYTGSTEVGRDINLKCAAQFKRCALELGGKNPFIVLKDYDVDEAVSIAAFGAFYHQGQICMCTSRIIVEAPIYDEFCRKFAAKAASIKMGDPHEKDTIVGPLINDRHYAVLDELIADAKKKGANLLCGGKHDGAFYAPSVLANVTDEMRIFHEECFGPVTSIVKAENAEDALRLANDNIYGLSSALLTNDLRLAMTMASRIEAGMVHVNDSTVMGTRRAPYGGIKNSGIGRENGSYSVEEFTELKWITYQTQKNTYPTD